MIEIKRLNHVQVCIPKGQDSLARDFYLGILNFKEIEKPSELKDNGGFWLEVANIQFHIGIEDSNVRSKKSHPAFEVTNLVKVKEYLISKNVQIEEQIKIPSQERFSFFDPFGNRIEFLEYL